MNRELNAKEGFLSRRTDFGSINGFFSEYPVGGGNGQLERNELWSFALRRMAARQSENHSIKLSLCFSVCVMNDGKREDDTARVPHNPVVGEHILI